MFFNIIIIQCFVELKKMGKDFNTEEIWTETFIKIVNESLMLSIYFVPLQFIKCFPFLKELSHLYYFHT